MNCAPDRSHILLIGDGFLQLTAQELSSILRHDFKPFIAADLVEKPFYPLTSTC
jgi:TPP-dependent 2-oxoacid decarboxylase